MYPFSPFILYICMLVYCVTRDPVIDDERDDSRPEVEDEEETSRELRRGVSWWEPQSRSDSFFVQLHRAALANVKVLVSVFLVFLILTQISITVVGLVLNPVIAAFALASVIPAAIVSIYIWDSDPSEHRPALYLLAAFSLGALVTGMAYVLNTAALPWFQGLPYMAMALFFFLWVAPVEEGLKLLAVHLSPLSSSYLETALDGMVLGAFAGLGFSAAENALYILTDGILGGGGIETLIGRAGVSPAHVVWTAIAGYYLGLAGQSPRHSGPILLKGLVTVVLLHGTYNTFVNYLPAAVAMLGRTDDLALQAANLVFMAGFYGLIFVKLELLIRRYRQAENLVGVRQGGGAGDGG